MLCTLRMQERERTSAVEKELEYLRMRLAVMSDMVVLGYEIIQAVLWFKFCVPLFICRTLETILCGVSWLPAWKIQSTRLNHLSHKIVVPCTSSCLCRHLSQNRILPATPKVRIEAFLQGSIDIAYQVEIIPLSGSFLSENYTDVRPMIWTRGSSPPCPMRRSPNAITLEKNYGEVETRL